MNATRDPAAVRARLAVADPACAAGAGLTVAELLRWTLQTRGDSAAIENTRRVREAVARSGIAAADLIDALPPAARLVVSLAAALVVRPDLLVVDDRPGLLRADAPIVACVSSVLARGGSIVMATDNSEIIRTLSARELRLEGGRVAATAAEPV
jgi:ABC-type ATPase involved in cell division